MAFDFSLDDAAFYDVGDFAVPAIYQPSEGEPVDIKAILSIELLGGGIGGSPYVPGVVPEIKHVATLSIADVGHPKQGDTLIIDTKTYVIDYIVDIDELDVEVTINEA